MKQIKFFWLFFLLLESRDTLFVQFFGILGQKILCWWAASHIFFLCRKKTGEVGNRSIDDDNGVQLFRARGTHEERFRKISNEVLANPVQFMYLFE